MHVDSVSLMLVHLALLNRSLAGDRDAIRFPGGKNAAGQYGLSSRTDVHRRGTSKKPVMVLVERDGSAHSKPIHEADATSLDSAMNEAVDFDSMLVTNEWASYRKPGRRFKGGHFVVNHRRNEYVRYTDKGPAYASTNTAESFFTLIKRGHYGIFHQLSHRHLHRYCNEFSFRWNHRKVTDGQRMVAAINGAEGRRLKFSSWKFGPTRVVS